ncbi:MAG: hypothetical protein K6G64_06120 [Eubacterium sp.]|nr:hypothetical protein [Eubacterium sp.]
MSNLIKKIFVFGFFCFIAAIGFLTLDNETEKSEVEGRRLITFPKLDYEKFSDSKYMQNIGDAFSDQLEYRTEMIKNYFAFTTNVLKIGYQGTTVIGKENYLFTEPEVITEEEQYDKRIKRIAKVINREAEKVTASGSKFIYIHYPRKDILMQSYLPSFYISGKERYEKSIEILKENLSDDVIFIDALALFEETGSEEYFYKTDHHVNIEGQEIIYKTVTNLMKEQFPEMDVKLLDSYKIKKTDIEGSFDRNIGNSIDSGKENLAIKPKGWKVQCKRNNNAKIWGKGNTYAKCFMGGDYAFTEVTTKNKKNPDVLICGSSFTNSLESLMVPSSRKMVSLDYRYNTQKKTMADFVEEYKPDYTIFIPCQSDKSFSYRNTKLHLGL